MSEEEWERFLRESVTGAAGAPVEPPARARGVERRLQERSGQPEGWRTRRPGECGSLVSGRRRTRSSAGRWRRPRARPA
ncbi:hypothetical protein ACWD6R_37070, partial [Streptomyces sp. NPDC005151]